MLTPDKTLKAVITTSVARSTAPAKKLIVFGLLAGIFIALASAVSTMASMNLLNNPDTYGLGRLIAGVIFVGGLAMVIIAGAELFTGNSLMVTALLNKKITKDGLLRNWCIVLLANLIGGVFVASLISLTGLFNANANLYGAMTIKIASTKTALDFIPALTLGILCNLLVCTAVWMASAAKSTSGKIAAIFFPIAFFVTMGFEHSVANAYYIPAGLFAASDPVLATSATDLGANLSTLNLVGLLNNFVPVILGNILGGGLLFATAYSLALNKTK